MGEFDEETRQHARPPHQVAAEADKHSTGNLLLKAGAITNQQLTEAAVHQYVHEETTGERLQIGELLVIRGFIKPRQLQAALDAQGVGREKKPDAKAHGAVKIAMAGIAAATSAGERLDFLAQFARDIARRMG